MTEFSSKTAIRSGGRTRKQTTCGHSDRPNKAFGMCQQCYNKNRMGVFDGWRPQEFRHPDIALNFKVEANCIICGDAVSLRQCQLHPEICGACEAEYCEHTLTLPKLMELEDIAKLREDDQVILLAQRKAALRAAGKNTNSIPLVRVDAPVDERVGVTPPHQHGYGLLSKRL